MHTNGVSDHMRTNAVPTKAGPVHHPLDQLDRHEIDTARETVLKARGNVAILFRAIFTQEPAKADLIPFLDAEHSGNLSSTTSRPLRLAEVQYDVINDDRSHDYMESVVDIAARAEIKHRVVGKEHQSALTLEEFKAFQEACIQSPLYKEALSKFDLPDGFEVAIDPWPYGGPDPGEIFPRYTQGLCFAKDMRRGNDSNHYGYPLPIIPVMDTYKSEIVRIDKLATGGKQDGLAHDTHPRNVLDHCKPAEYVPELLDIPLRSDLKPLHLVQPEGPSFTVSTDSLVQWQKWRFRVGFNPREGATLHDVYYDNRSILYRLSLSEMTVPYGDPRPPYHRKQAFDFGDGGAGRAANNLALGCDCLGVIKYIDATIADSEGKPSLSKNVVCLHEQDAGIGWKHTDFRTGRAVVTRARELVIQFIITLANYEYIFAYKFDQAAGITVETRATGIVSVVNIDAGKTSPYGNVVSPGALAQNHQHIFALRIDPAVDGHRNTVVTEESLPMPMELKSNPFGNGYRIVTTPITKATSLDSSPSTNRTLKITNTAHLNPISSKPVSYKLQLPATQLMLADRESTVARRAQFAQHAAWVTSYRDGELWAGGEFTNQSRQEIGGVGDMVAREDNVENSDVVVWAVWGLTHNPRVEDWPVMPCERFEIGLRPGDFFTRNPALDVPGLKDMESVLVNGNGECCASGEAHGVNGGGAVQQDPTSHMQGLSIGIGETNGVNGHH